MEGAVQIPRLWCRKWHTHSSPRACSLVATKLSLPLMADQWPAPVLSATLGPLPDHGTGRGDIFGVLSSSGLCPCTTYTLAFFQMPVFPLSGTEVPPPNTFRWWCRALGKCGWKPTLPDQLLLIDRLTHRLGLWHIDPEGLLFYFTLCFLPCQVKFTSPAYSMPLFLEIAHTKVSFWIYAFLR